MTTDPARRMIRCPECGKLQPLNADGRFEAHVGATLTGWCPTSGMSFGKAKRRAADRRQAERAREEP